MWIGQTRITPVVEIDEMAVDPVNYVIGVKPEDVAPHAEDLPPGHVDPASGDCLVSIHAWLIEAKGKRILIDPCVGHHRQRPAIPFFHMVESPLLGRLEALGAPAESIDYVFCTHLHLDHVGWNTRAADGRMVPTFPNARYLFSRAEDAFWRRDLTGDLPAEDLFNSGVYAECVAPVIAAGLADLVEPGARIADCLSLVAAAGHTIGHMAAILESAGEGAAFCGDAIHHPIQVLFPDRPSPAYDAVQASRTRRMLLDLCVARDYWLVPAHFRPPHLCKVTKSGDDHRMVWPQ